MLQKLRGGGGGSTMAPSYFIIVNGLREVIDLLNQ